MHEWTSNYLVISPAPQMAIVAPDGRSWRPNWPSRITQDDLPPYATAIETVIRRNSNRAIETYVASSRAAAAAAELGRPEQLPRSRKVIL